MRPDFKHLLTERERHNSRWDGDKGHSRAVQRDENQNFEDWAPGRKVSVKKYHTGASKKSKSLNENLNPLQNFLLGAAGRLWDDVYAEINEACPKDSAVSAHIYEHLFQYVERNPRFSESGDVYRSEGYWNARPMTSSRIRPQLYIHPDTGILIEAPREAARISWSKKEAAERLKYERKIDGKFLVKVKDFWCEAQMKPFPAPKLRLPDDKHETEWFEEQPFVDVYFNQTPTYKNSSGYHAYSFLRGEALKSKLNSYYGDHVYCHTIRQLNSAELRRYNLKNS